MIGSNGNDMNKPQQSFNIVIEILGDKTTVRGFPVEANTAMDCMLRAAKEVALFFVNSALDGKVTRSNIQVVPPVALDQLSKMGVK